MASIGVGEVEMNATKRMYWIIFTVFMVSLIALGQDDRPRPGGRWADQPHANGQITAINGNTITVQTPDNKTSTIKFTSDTQFRKNRTPAKLEDFKVGDTILAVGERKKTDR